jgi:hypothetical protein
MIGGSQYGNNIRGHPLEEPLKIYPVSDLVNSPKTDNARCIDNRLLDGVGFVEAHGFPL